MHGPIDRAIAFVQAIPPSARGPIAVVRDRDAVVVALDPVDRIAADGLAGVTALDRIWRSGGFWVGALAYDLGRSIETVDAGVNAVARDDRGFPDVAFTRFARAVRFTATGANQPGSRATVELGGMGSS